MSSAASSDPEVKQGATYTQALGDLEGAALAAVHQRDQVSFLLPVELGLLPAEPALDLRYLHAFAGMQPDQVGRELGDHGTR